MSLFILLSVLLGSLAVIVWFAEQICRYFGWQLLVSVHILITGIYGLRALREYLFTLAVTEPFLPLVLLPLYIAVVLWIAGFAYTSLVKVFPGEY